MTRLPLAAATLGSLTWFCLVFALGVTPTTSVAQTDPAEPTDALLDKIITPDIERPTITEDQLDSEDWELGLYTGVHSIEDFGSNTLVGARLAYHMTEDFVIELNYAQSEAKESSVEVLGGDIQLLNDDQRDYGYYTVSLAYNVLPGEVFLGSNTAYNIHFYLLLGAGNTQFNDNDYFTYSIGGGLRFYLTDSVALHATVKDHLFSNDLVDDKRTNNLEATLGVSLYF